MVPPGELLERCRKNDRKAHYELYSLCFPFLVSICRRYYINREDMLSAVNQSYVKIIVNLNSYIRKSERVPFELWARRITINNVIDEFRKNKAYREKFELSELSIADDTHPSSDPFVEMENVEEIRNAIHQLSYMNRTVFNLFVVDGYAHEEIASMLKISEGTSKAHLHQAKKKLRQLLEIDNKKKVMVRNTILQ
jgi:RNA polymerase sigma factor (sigma-70 family)